MDLRKHTPDDLRQMAADRHRRSQESFERSDTDGFLSQWAADMMARLYSDAADLAEADWHHDFPCLMDGDRRIDAKLLCGDRGSYWLLGDDEATKYGRRFVPYAGSTVKNPRVQRSLGLHEDYESAPAYIKLEGDGAGMYPHIFRTDGK